MSTEQEHGASVPRVIPVIGGRFECPHCFAVWVGTWHGDRSLMTCIRCERPMEATRDDD